MKIKSTLAEQRTFWQAQIDLFATFAAKRFGQDPEAGEMIAGLWVMIGLIVLAVAVVALITAKVMGKLNSMPS